MLASDNSESGTSQECDPDEICCGEDGRFLPSTEICKENANPENPEYGCPWGSQKGSNVGIRYQDQYCSGASSSCNGELRWNDWSVHNDCSETQICLDKLCQDVTCFAGDVNRNNRWLDQQGCKEGSVYDNYLKFECINPGTPQSEWVSTTTSMRRIYCNPCEDCTGTLCKWREGCELPGDADNNKKIDIFDILEILRVLGGSKQATRLSDANSDGKTNIFDLLEILKMLKNQRSTASLASANEEMIKEINRADDISEDMKKKVIDSIK